MASLERLLGDSPEIAAVRGPAAMPFLFGHSLWVIWLDAWVHEMRPLAAHCQAALGRVLGAVARPLQGEALGAEAAAYRAIELPPRPERPGSSRG